MQIIDLDAKVIILGAKVVVFGAEIIHFEANVILKNIVIISLPKVKIILCAQDIKTCYLY